MIQRLDFLDVSHWNGSIDWERVAAAGVLGAIAKCTDGTSYVDETYQTNRAGALGSGLAFSSYHYLQHGNANRQMEFYLATAIPQAGERVVIDYEESDPAVTIDDLSEAVSAVRLLRPDVEITIYGASKLTEDVVNGDHSFLVDTSLWAARYSSNEPVIATDVWSTWSAWQYSDEGKVDGISTPVDLNMFNGPAEACLAWFGPPASMPLPGPQPEPDEPFVISAKAFGHEVTISIDPEGAEVWIDGEEV